MNEINIRTSLSSVDPRDERIYELEDKIEELQLELDQKDIIIKQKDAVSCVCISSATIKDSLALTVNA